MKKKTKKMRILLYSTVTKKEIKISRGVAAFFFGLLIDWTFEGRVKGWVGTTLQLMLPFVLMILTSIVVADAFDEGCKAGRGEGERKTEET